MGGVELMVTLLDWTRHPAEQPILVPAATSVPSNAWARAPERALSVSRYVADRLPALARAATNPAGAVRTAWRTGGSVVRVVAPGGQRMSPVFVGHSTKWCFDVHDESMEALQQAAARAGGTVNDVFVAALAGALHRYHLQHGSDVDGLRLTLPVSLRREGDPPGGNRFTPVRFTLPIAERDPGKRIREVGALCRKWREEPALPLTDAIASVLSQLPPAATTAVMGALLKGIDMVATNVRGVPRRCYIAGAELLREYAFAPLSGAALNVSLMSHAGTACIGVNMDGAA